MDSGASQHMIRNLDLLHDIKSKEGFVTFGNFEKSKIIGISKVKVTNTIFISNVLLVKDLGFNLLSVN
jgi:hypothetical protein